MSEVLSEVQDNIGFLTLNRVHKHNAFNAEFLIDMQKKLDAAIINPKVKVLILKANGTHFCAGADLNWMQSMIHSTEEENYQDAMILSSLIYTLYHCPKPTIAMVHGSAFGGGAGLIAACDIAIGSESARFCFSEVKLGLIPAIISPYIIEAIGPRASKMLFMSAEIFDAQRALNLNLLHYCLEDHKLKDFTLNYAKQITANAPEAVKLSKQLVQELYLKPIDKEIMCRTATLIAQKRISKEGQLGLNAFLNKQTPNWN